MWQTWAFQINCVVGVTNWGSTWQQCDQWQLVTSPFQLHLNSQQKYGILHVLLIVSRTTLPICPCTRVSSTLALAYLLSTLSLCWSHEMCYKNKTCCCCCCNPTVRWTLGGNAIQITGLLVSLNWYTQFVFEKLIYESLFILERQIICPIL